MGGCQELMPCIQLVHIIANMGVGGTRPPDGVHLPSPPSCLPPSPSSGGSPTHFNDDPSPPRPPPPRYLKEVLQITYDVTLNASDVIWEWVAEGGGGGHSLGRHAAAITSTPATCLPAPPTPLNTSGPTVATTQAPLRVLAGPPAATHTHTHVFAHKNTWHMSRRHTVCVLVCALAAWCHHAHRTPRHPAPAGQTSHPTRP